MSNPLQKFEWMLRIPICNMQTGQELLKRIPDHDDDERYLRDALNAMSDAIECLHWWADRHGVVIRESMHT